MLPSKTCLRLAAVVAVVLSTSAASATTMVLVDHASHARMSDLVVHGRVTQKTVTPGPEGNPYTDTHIRISRTLKGQARGGSITVRQLGGPTRAGILRVVGDASFSVGEEVVLFLADRLLNSGVYVLTAMGQSKFSVVGTGADGQPLLLRDLRRLDLVGTRQTAIGDLLPLPMKAITEAIATTPVDEVSP